MGHRIVITSQVIITGGRSNNSSRGFGSCADLAEGRAAGRAALGGPAAPFIPPPHPPPLPEPRPALSDNIPQPPPEDYSTPEHWPPSRRKEGGIKKGQPSLPPLFHLKPSSPAPPPRPPPPPPTPPFSPQHSTFPVGVCKARITLRPQLVRCQKH